jgi:hypothetical protein
MIEDGWAAIKGFVDNFISRTPADPPFIGAVSATPGDSLALGRAFVPEASYFCIQLVDMRLAEGGKYFVDFLPLGVCVAEYTYGAERRRVPLVLSNEAVKQMLGDAGGQPGQVQFANMPVVRRTPFKQDNLALFVGLFRMPYNDVARSVLQLAADVSSELGGAAFAAGTKVATKLYDSVAAIFKLTTVQPRFAFLNGMALTKSQYLLVSGSLPKGLQASDLVVKDSRLRLQRDVNAQLPSFDYCLLAIEHTDSLFASSDPASATAMLRTLAGLPFHQRWGIVRSMLAQRKVNEAEEALLNLKAEVVSSPDLTEEDRLVAVGGYDVAYAQYRQTLAPNPDKATTRGSLGTTSSAGLKNEAAARKRDGDKPTATALDAIAVHLQMKKGGGPNASLATESDQLLAEAFAGIRPAMAAAHAQGVRASTLAGALLIGSAATRPKAE